MSSLGPSDSTARLRVHDASPLFDESSAASLRRAWQEGLAPPLESFVTGLTDVSPRELASLIQVDFDERWSRNDRQRPEEYLRRFPSVAADAELAVDVIYTEYLARVQSGESPERAEYESRFPALAKVLAEQIRLHDALDKIQEEESLVDLSEIDPVASSSEAAALRPIKLTRSLRFSNKSAAAEWAWSTRRARRRSTGSWL